MLGHSGIIPYALLSVFLALTERSAYGSFVTTVKPPISYSLGGRGF